MRTCDLAELYDRQRGFDHGPDAQPARAGPFKNRGDLTDVCGSLDFRDQDRIDTVRGRYR